MGAKPEAARAVLRHFGPYDALAPMPLLALQLACGFAMPFVNLASMAADTALPKLTRGALPRLYRWRLSKMHFLYSNSLVPRDFKGVYTQWLASSVVLGHLLKRSIRGWLARAPSETPRRRPVETSSGEDRRWSLRGGRRPAPPEDASASERHVRGAARATPGPG